ncbi:hypothetical protein ACO0LC_22975 [Undibacterium sp. JH2W]|uniref:hypothetical protein n=1 Tax=Undibacterium sp. JH2W TaxID=3413037 RepID=UPI003BF35909
MASGQSVDLPVLMVNVRGPAGSAPVYAHQAYHSIFAHAPYLSWIIMLCACLLPLGMLVVTTATIMDFRKRRSDDDALSHRTDFLEWAS